MPTATSFTALGAGNGFNSCLSKQNVANYDYWTTLSGWNKNNTPATAEAKAQSITDSHALAMSMYWNLYQVTGYAEVIYFLYDAVEVSAVTVGRYYNPPNSGNLTAIEPMDRACISGGLFSQETATDEESGTSYMQINGSILRLYDGDTTDESNFVGYGASSNFITAAAQRPSTYTATVKLSSMLFSDTSASYDYAYVSRNGVSFVCEAYGDTPNASALTTSSSGGIAPADWWISASISSFAFWTY
jgi:hypothetical protein